MSPFIQSTGLTHLMKLVLCAKYNDETTDIIGKIINDNPDEINKQCDSGWTALMIACRNSNTCSNIEIVKVLLGEPNVDINKKMIKVGQL